MRRVSLEEWVLFIPAVTLLVLLTVLAVAISGREPPKFAQLPMLVAALAGPFIDCGVIALALIFRWRGALKLKHPYVLTGITLACLNILITAGLLVMLYVISRAMSGGSLIFG